jgi:hypothetical protein
VEWHSGRAAAWAMGHVRRAFKIRADSAKKTSGVFFVEKDTRRLFGGGGLGIVLPADDLVPIDAIPTLGTSGRLYFLGNI